MVRLILRHTLRICGSAMGPRLVVEMRASALGLGQVQPRGSERMHAQQANSSTDNRSGASPLRRTGRNRQGGDTADELPHGRSVESDALCRLVSRNITPIRSCILAAPGESARPARPRLQASTLPSLCLFAGCPLSRWQRFSFW